MTKFLSGRQSQLNIGVSSNTENKTVLQITGKVGIGTTNAGSKNLYVVGDTEITGVTTIGGSLSVSGGLNVVGVTTFSGQEASQLNVSGVGTISRLNSTYADLININSSGISTLADIKAQRITATGIITANSFRPTSGYIQASDGVNAFYIYDSTGNVTFLGEISVSQINNSNGLLGVITFNNRDTRLTGSLNVVGVTTSSVFNGNLYSLGVSTFRNGPVLVGSSSSTGTLSQRLQVTGGAYVSGNFGIGNTLPTTALSVVGDGNFTGVVTASQFSTGSVGSAINITNDSITGPSSIIIDPAGVGDDTGSVRVKGDLYVDGTQFVVNSTTIELADFNVGIATTVGNNLLLDGAGIGIGSDGIRKTLTYDYTNNSLKSSENFNIPSGKSYKIDGTDALSGNTLGSGIVYSSLQYLGTLNNLNVSGLSTLPSLVGTYATISEISNTYFNSGVATITDLRAQQFSVSGASVHTGISTFQSSLLGTQASFTGIVTANSFRPSSGYYQSANGTNAFYVFDGSGDVSFQGKIVTNYIRSNTNLNPTITVSDLDLQFARNVTISGITTSTGGFVGNLTGTATTATNVVGGIASVASLNVTGLSTFIGISTFQSSLFGTQASFIGVVTATTFDGDLNAPGKTYYVAINGSDSNSGDNINEPYASVAYALSVATSGDAILIQSGTFTEVFPLTVPVGVTVRGVGIRGTFIQPTAGTKQNDGFLLNGDTTVEDLTIGNMYEPGYAFKFASGKKTTNRSPYIQRVTVLNRGSVTSSSDPYGFDTPHSPPTSYKAGRGVLIDGSVVDSTTLEPAMLFNECTFICPNNTALEMTNGARTEWVNCFTYFADKAIYAYDGNVGLASTGSLRVKTSGFSGTTPAANDELYYLQTNSVSGTYSQVGTALTITRVGHGLTVGDRIFADFTSGTATDGFYRITEYVGINTFSVTMVGSATTSGNVSYKETLGFGTVRSYTSASGLSSITGKGEGLFELPSSRLGKTVTAFGNAQLSTTQQKFGTASLILDGTGDYASVASNTDFGFGTSNFTLESFVRLVGAGTTQTIFDLRSLTTSDSAIIVGISTTNIVNVSYGSTTIITGSTALTTGQWYHVALSRSSGSTRLFISGTQEGSTYSDSNDYGISKPLVIGADYAGTNNFNGYIDEVRVSNSARYTGTFTPTISAFNSDGNDKLLLHFDGITGSTSFADSSIQNQDIRWVRNGIGIATATRITLADYQQFGAEMRSIGSAAVFGNTGISADGPGVTLRLFAFNFGHIGSGKDFSQDISLVNQADEVVTSNNGKVYFVSIDQSGDFRVGDAFYVNQEDGTVNFGGQNFTLNSLSDLNITDGTNTNTITPTTATFGNIQISANEITSTSGNITINPSGSSETIVSGNLNVSGILTASILQTGALQLGDTSIAIDDTGSNGTIRFNTDGTESLRITNTQRVGIGSQSPAYPLDVLGDINSSTAVKVNGVSVVQSAVDEALALAIALG